MVSTREALWAITTPITRAQSPGTVGDKTLQAGQINQHTALAPLQSPRNSRLYRRKPEFVGATVICVSSLRDGEVLSFVEKV